MSYDMRDLGRAVWPVRARCPDCISKSTAPPPPAPTAGCPGRAQHEAPSNRSRWRFIASDEHRSSLTNGCLSRAVLIGAPCAPRSPCYERGTAGTSADGGLRLRPRSDDRGSQGRVADGFDGLSRAGLNRASDPRASTPDASSRTFHTYVRHASARCRHGFSLPRQSAAIQPWM
jgi:hypothetical protein